MTTFHHSPSVSIRDLKLVGNFAELKNSLMNDTEHALSLNDMTGQSYFYGKVLSFQPEVTYQDRTVSTFVVEFNTECRGWHYSWTGSRFKTCVLHVFAIHIFPFSSDPFRSVTIRSPSFMIASLRRKGGQMFQNMQNQLREAEIEEREAFNAYARDDCNMTSANMPTPFPLGFYYIPADNPLLNLLASTAADIKLPLAKKTGVKRARSPMDAMPPKKVATEVPSLEKFQSPLSLGIFPGSLVKVRSSGFNDQIHEAIVISHDKGGDVVLKYLDSELIDKVPAQLVTLLRGGDFLRNSLYSMTMDVL